MAFINHFAEADDERTYVQDERASRLKATRAIIILGPLIFLGFFMLTPVFSSNEAFATFNITTVAIVGFLRWRYLPRPTAIISNGAGSTCCRSLP
ncbi:hypothetical protein C8024_04200 [Sphingopyxis sp. BSNA05]|uniref:hypothetical protein n=1 Tax=Sphingopyxis sp. BSNA05 TaxID=1236614 RepID=UPI001563F9B9|nr:hypothetical protein [Sphingopyxis sp. BSNA05]NRD88830.1 hypothetical protein [Sphingopyxis sp. BSNA05]